MVVNWVEWASFVWDQLRRIQYSVMPLLLLLLSMPIREGTSETPKLSALQLHAHAIAMAIVHGR
jgi:hypothetical protein